MKAIIQQLMDFPGGSAGKEHICSTGDLGSILGLRRAPGGGHCNPYRLENPHGQRRLVGCSPCSVTQSDMTEQLRT